MEVDELLAAQYAEQQECNGIKQRVMTLYIECKRMALVGLSPLEPSAGVKPQEDEKQEGEAPQ